MLDDTYQLRKQRVRWYDAIALLEVLPRQTACQIKDQFLYTATRAKLFQADLI